MSRPAWLGTDGNLAFTSITAATAWATANPSLAYDGLLATAGGSTVVWRGTNLGWQPLVATNSRAWTGLGDSITATNFAFSLATIQNLGMQPAGIGYGDYSVQLFGYSGKRSDEILQYIPNVIASGAKNCIVMVGSNNANQNTSLSAFYSDLVSFYTGLAAGGVNVIACHIPPGTATPANIYKFNCAVSKAAEKCGVQVLSPWDAFADAATGALVSGLDSTHPTPSQSAAAAAICVQQIKDNQTSKILTNSNVGGLVTNPCFVGDANADGLADSWSTVGAGLTFSLVAGQNGNKQRVVTNIASGTSSIYQGLPAPVVGNRVKITGKMRITAPSNCAVSVYVRFKNSGGTGLRDAFLFYNQEASDIDLIGDTEVVVPATTASAQLWLSITKGGTPAAYPVVATVDFERVQIVDLTAVGLA